MTTIPKIAATAVLIAAIGLGIHETKKANDARTEVQVYQRKIAQLEADTGTLSDRLAQANRPSTLGSERLRELLRLRGEVGMLRQQQRVLQDQLTASSSRLTPTSGQRTSGTDLQSAPGTPFKVQLVLDETREDSELVTNDAGAETLNVQKTPLMDHTAIQSTSVAINPTTGEPQIDVEFSDIGAELFAAVTRENLNKRLAIVLNGKLYSTPIVQSEVSGGKAQITGNFTQEEAHALAATINEAIKTQRSAFENK